MCRSFAVRLSQPLIAAVLLLSVARRVAAADEELYPLSLIHINDFHARYEPTDVNGGTCDPADPLAHCVGGYARTVHTVRQLQRELQVRSNPLYLNAGDSFQGTLWYTVGRWNVTSQFLNMLPADAMTLGNHEFDHNIAGCVPFLETVNTQMLVANMDAAYEPTMQGLYKPSLLLERAGRQIGLIGVILETTYDLSLTGALIFSNESAAIRAEAQQLRAAGANIIVVISHCGYDVDQTIARQVGGDIDVIVGGHSHTYLYSGAASNGAPDAPLGDYPTVVTTPDGQHRVLIVQAGAYAKYVGNFTVYFDAAGEAVRWEGAPIYMSADVPEDAQVLAALQPWRDYLADLANEPLGVTRVNLERTPCSYEECNLGNFFCDAMVHAFVDLAPYDRTEWTSAAVGLANAGTFRVPLIKGNITYAHMVTMCPYENTLIAFSLSGEQLLAALEYSVSYVDLSEGGVVGSSASFMQVAGLRIIYDYSKPAGQRAVEVRVRCAACEVPVYEPLVRTRQYRIVSTAYLLAGGGGYDMISEHATDLQYEMKDIDALAAYTKYATPISTAVEGRIKILQPSTAAKND